jgi:hypothetical protein
MLCAELGIINNKQSIAIVKHWTATDVQHEDPLCLKEPLGCKSKQC